MEPLDTIQIFRPKPLNEYINFKEYIVDVSREIKDEKALCCIGKVPLFTMGNISCITGKAKSRKTFFASSICAAIISGNYLGITSEEKGKVLYIDTEQGFSHVQKLAKRILFQSGLNTGINSHKLTVYALRSLSPEERITAIKQAIEAHKPAFVVVDGVRDLILDFNDIRSSAEITGLLMKLSADYNCHITSVLHQNKADNNMRGHMGSELLNKAETVLEVTTVDETTKVRATYTRGLPPEDIHFEVDNLGIPVYKRKPIKADLELEEKKQNMIKCIGQSGCKYKELVGRYIKFSGKGERTSKKVISELLALDYIYKDENDNYILSESENIFKYT